VAVACAPALAHMGAAYGDDTGEAVEMSSADELTGTTEATSSSTTTVAPNDPAPLEDPPPESTAPPTEPAPTTEAPTTTPSTGLDINPTLPPITLPPATTPPDTQPTTTVTTAPSDDTGPDDGSAPPVGAPGNDDDTGRGGTDGQSATRKGSGRGNGSHDAAPERELFQASPQEFVALAASKDSNILTALPAVMNTPARSIKAGVGNGLELTAKALGGFDPTGSANTWGGLGSAAPRFGPWIVLLGMAWIVRTVIASILADRTAGARRRRWTLL